MFGAGPYISFSITEQENRTRSIINGDFKSNESNDLSVGDQSGPIQTFDFGMNALAGFEIGHVFLSQLTLAGV